MPESISGLTPQQFVQQTQQVEQVPTDLVPLPSKGVVYPPGHPFCGKEAVAIKSMTAHEEDILTSRALIKSGKLISALIKSCLMDKDVDPEMLLVGDRNAILLGIRITGYGADYPVDVTCPACTAAAKHIFDLSSIPIKRFPEDLGVTQGTNEFAFSLPVSKRQVKFKLIDGATERELSQIVERGRKAGLADEIITNRLKAQIISIDGEQDKNKLAVLIRNMAARDSRELRAYMDRITPTVELKQKFSCDVCSYEGEVDVPLGTEFFWPEA